MQSDKTSQSFMRTRRDSKAGISFVHVSDGSAFHPVQVVAPNTLPNYADEVQKLTTGCAVEATGTALQLLLIEADLDALGADLALIDIPIGLGTPDRPRGADVAARAA